MLVFRHEEWLGTTPYIEIFGQTDPVPSKMPIFKATGFNEITRNKGHNAVQGHSRSGAETLIFNLYSPVASQL